MPAGKDPDGIGLIRLHSKFFEATQAVKPQATVCPPVLQLEISQHGVWGLGSANVKG